MKITKITPSTQKLNDLANGMKKYLSEVSHEYLNRSAVLPDTKLCDDIPSSYPYFSPATPIASTNQSIGVGSFIDFIS